MKEIIELLQANKWDEGNEYIQIAKGKYHYPSTFREWLNKLNIIFKQTRT